MSEQRIECPHCGNEFALDAAFQKHFDEEKRRAVQTALKNAEKKAEDERKRLEADFDQEREDLQKALDEEREKLETQAMKDAEKKFQLDLEAKDEAMRRVQKQLEDLQRRTQQGSMELQGESLEVFIQRSLEDSFPLDDITEVKKGQSGADITHIVMNHRGQRCGTIAWEAKNTKRWSDKWLDKIKDDASRSGAQVRVIVSAALPEGIETFDLREGVWITSVDAAVALARVLRENLTQAHDLKKAVEGQDTKMAEVYAYLVSTEFRDRVQRMVDTWMALKIQVDKEQVAMERQWAERRKQLNKMIRVTTDMYTDVSHIIGQSMPQVDGLSLEALPAGDEDQTT